MSQISLSEYYPWRGLSAFRYPWERQYVNVDFLKYERSRIKELSEWYRKFLDARIGSYVDEASFYTVPVELSSSWKSAIAMRGNYNFVGLSALYNSPQILLIALIHQKLKQPEDYRLIHVVKSRKTLLVNPRSGEAEYALIIEEWEYLDSDHIYVDVPFEKRVIENIIGENLTSEGHVPLAFQSPIVSAPYVAGGVGGVSLSSLAASSSFARELVKTIQLMVPPEYRTTLPPGSAYKGYKFPYANGISFHLAERPYYDKNLLSGLYARSYSPLLREVQRRFDFHGEYSIFSTLVPEKSSTSQFLTELFRNFSSTEITLPYDLDELPLMDVELTQLKKAIDEDIWLQVVYSRQFQPGLTDEADKWLVKITVQLKESLEAQFSELFRRARIRYMVDSMMPRIQGNLMRVAQSIARAEERGEILVEHLKRARGMILDSLNELMSHEIILREKEVMRRRKESSRFAIIQTELINNPYSTAAEIWGSVKHTGEFRDIEDLQRFLDWLHRKGFVILTREKRYLWVGPPR